MLNNNNSNNSKSTTTTTTNPNNNSNKKTPGIKHSGTLGHFEKNKPMNNSYRPVILSLLNVVTL